MGPSWHQLSNCTGLDLDVFYGSDENKPMTVTELRAVRKLCRYCPARRDCLTEALVSDERFGIWGGFTGPERGRIRTIYSNTENGRPQMDMVMAALGSGTLEAQVVIL